MTYGGMAVYGAIVICAVLGIIKELIITIKRRHEDL